MNIETLGSGYFTLDRNGRGDVRASSVSSCDLASHAGAVAKIEEKNILILLSAALMDFDTFLPTAIEIKKANPHFRIRFITFQKGDYDLMRANPALMAGLSQCGSLHLLEDGGVQYNLVQRQAARIKMILIMTYWILRRSRPVQVRALAFDDFPFSYFRWLAGRHGGKSLLLSKFRAPDRVYYYQTENIESAMREKGGQEGPHVKLDAIAYYHDEQKLTLKNRFLLGRPFSGEWIKIGLPSSDAWKGIIQREKDRYIDELAKKSGARATEYFALFAAKLHSGVNLQTGDSVVDTFRQVLSIVSSARPNAFILIRPHPSYFKKEAMRQYIRNAVEDICPGRAEVTLAHPEVLYAISERAIFFAPTNLLYDFAATRIIDCSAYKDQHYIDFGDVSIAHGYGPIHINPRRSDFESRLLNVLNSDDAFHDDAVFALRNELVVKNPSNLKPLLDFLEPSPSRI